MVWRYRASDRRMDRKSDHASMRLEAGPRYLIRDRDGAYGEVFIRRVRSMGIRDRPTSPCSPWQNACAERLIGSIRRECLDHVVVFGERHLRHVLLSYMNYYNETRTHLSLDKDAPLSRTVQRAGRILRLPILGGLHHYSDLICDRHRVTFGRLLTDYEHRHRYGRLSRPVSPACTIRRAAGPAVRYSRAATSERRNRRVSFRYRRPSSSRTKSPTTGKQRRVLVPAQARHYREAGERLQRRRRTRRGRKFGARNQLLVDLLFLGRAQAVRDLDHTDTVDERLVFLVGLEALPFRLIRVRQDDAAEGNCADIFGADVIAFLRCGEQRVQHLDRCLEHLDEFEDALIGVLRHLRATRWTRLSVWRSIWEEARRSCMRQMR